MKVLNVIRTKENLKDRNSDLYLKAIQKRAIDNDIEVRIIAEYPGDGFVTKEFNKLRIKLFCSMYKNTIVLEPCEHEFNRLLTLDKFLTAQAIFKVIEERYMFEKNKPVVAILSRSSLIGRPLSNMLLDNDYTVIQAHSKTSKDDLYILCNYADVIVTATGKDMTELFKCVSNKNIIDVSNDIRTGSENKLADRKEIGKRTLDLLFEELKRLEQW